MAAKRRTAVKRMSVEERLDAHGVLLENIQSQLQFVAEAVPGLAQSMDRKLEELEARLTARIEVLEEVVRENSRAIRQNSEDIKKNSEDIKKNSEDIKKNSEDIRVAREEIAQLRRDFEKRSELARVEALEQRLARVEAKLGIAS